MGQPSADPAGDIGATDAIDPSTPARDVEKPRVMITEPGIYRDFDGDSYFADPCPEPSLSQSIAKVLIEQSAQHAAVEHPRLSVDAEGDDAVDAEGEKYVKAQAIGNAAHKLILGRGKEIEIIDRIDFKSKEARDLRDAATASGRVPILKKHMLAAERMVAAAWTQIKRHEADDCFRNGAGEVMIAWQEDGIWFRSLIDWLHDDLLTVDDYKTGGVSVAPHGIGMRMVDQGWDIQAAMIERGLAVLDPERAGRRRFRFIAQENEAPFAMTVCQLSESVLTMGRKKLQAAIDIWRRCIETDTWPPYINRVILPEYPGWQESRWLDREVSGEFDAPAAAQPERDGRFIMAG